MATLQFHIHTDKENATVKSVGGSKTRILQTHKTPRRALGSVNEANRVGGKALALHPTKNDGSLAVSALKLKNVTAEKDLKQKQRRQQDKENNVVERVKQHEEKNDVNQFQKSTHQQASASLHLPDIEYMPPASPPRDEDEDILPRKQRPSTYMHRLLSWRPPCLFGVQPESDEEEERERQQIMDDLDKLPLPNSDDLFPPDIVLEELDVDSIELPVMEDFPLTTLE